MKPIVDRTISTLAATRFVVDPIAGDQLSKITSIVSSAYKRHGAIIEVALYEAISRKNGIDAESKVLFYVNRNASSYIESYDIKDADGLKACLESSTPYRLKGS